MHGERFVAPASLMSLTPLMVQDTIAEFQSLKAAVNRRDPGDGVLHQASHLNGCIRNAKLLCVCDTSNTLIRDIWPLMHHWVFVVGLFRL